MAKWAGDSFAINSPLTRASPGIADNQSKPKHTECQQCATSYSQHDEDLGEHTFSANEQSQRGRAADPGKRKG